VTDTARLDAIRQRAWDDADEITLHLLKDPEMMISALAPGLVPHLTAQLREEFGDLSVEEAEVAAAASKAAVLGWLEQMVNALDLYFAPEFSDPDQLEAFFSALEEGGVE
jgi:hypothetical protein